jgi:hypothetical protein
MQLLRRPDAVGFSPERIRMFARWAVLCVALLLLVSCSRPLRLQVVLEKNEDLTKGMPVFVDSTKAGTVIAIGEEGGERVANLAITLKEARDRLRVGAVRVRESGRIQINTDAVKDGAAVLPHGARIPTTSKVGYLVAKYSQTSTLMAVGIAVVILVILWLVFRSLVGTIGLVLCVLLSGVVTQAIHPYVVPWVEKALNCIGPPPASPATLQVQEQPKPAAAEATTTGPLPPAAQVYKQAESTIIEVMNARPSPVVLTWCIVFVACFIGFNLVLGRVSRVWRKK